MKKSELKQLIKEEIRKVLGENTQYKNLKPLEDILLNNGYKFLGDNKSWDRADYRGSKGEVALFADYTENDITSGGNILKKGGKYPVRIMAFGGDFDKNYLNIKDAESDLNELIK